METVRWKGRQVEWDLHDEVSYPICTLKQYRLRHTLHSGGVSDWMLRTCVHRAPIVVVLPYDPVKDCFVLIEQFRVGALFGTEPPWLFEVVAGMIDSGQTALETAHKELLEETGLTSKNLELVSEYWVSPGGSDEYAHMFMAIVDATQIQPIAGVATEHENIRVVVQNRADVYQALSDGKINNGATLMSLLWFKSTESQWVNIT